MKWATMLAGLAGLAIAQTAVAQSADREGRWETRIGGLFLDSSHADFGGGTTVLQDAWLDFKPSPKLRVRVGKYKSPVGLERLQSATALTFVERAFPTLIVPNRDVGVMLHGELAGGVVAYAAGLFDGAPDGGSVH